jgi:hypothetical protein
MRLIDGLIALTNLPCKAVTLRLEEAAQSKYFHE